MGLRRYKWRNHWIWTQRRISIEKRVTPKDTTPGDYGDDPPLPDSFI
jgi:hypothetical protein